ncbi:hypothetical protein F4809DRAFT_619827 [Biscogniauxia mediterranea]|nr:hypothetical protein F4809DRAFT_619827 [Biscogniauxia mediterranea]
MPSTLLPFLYQTRTILRMPPRMRIRTRTPVALARSLHATCIRCKAHNDIPFATDVPGEDVPMETPRGTITPSERQVFERIFADIRARGLKPQPREDEPPAAQASQSSRSAMLIMQQAAQDALQARPATIRAPSLLAGAAKDRNKALLRFPPELRAAASKALEEVTSQSLDPRRAAGELDDDHSAAAADEEMASDQGWKAPAHSFGRTIELEAKRHPERMRVEGMIMNANTDFELWDVLEKEVFTMPAKLGLGRDDVETEENGAREDNNEVEATAETESAIDAESKPEAETEAEIEAESGAKSEDEAPAEAAVAEASYDAEAEPATEAENSIEAEDTEDTEDIAPPKKLSLYVHGPLYPAYLLLALRRLNQAYHSPSPLVFTLLPRIKELGLKSYVLGVSTPFYNELLGIYWHRRGDLNGMLALLEEMRHCGLYFDEKTASIIDQVDEAVQSMAGKHNHSAFGRALMTMPAYETSGEYIVDFILYSPPPPPLPLCFIFNPSPTPFP